MKRLVIAGILIVFAIATTVQISDARHKNLRDRRVVSGIPQWRGWKGDRGWRIKRRFPSKKSWLDWRGSGGWGHGSDYQRKYDLKTITTVKGVVKAVELITPITGMSNGIHLKLETDSEVKSVHLGPSWYIRRQDIQINKGDTIEARGSKIVFRDKPAIIAAELKKGDSTLTLRDADGHPWWSGGRRAKR